MCAFLDPAHQAWVTAAAFAHAPAPTTTTAPIVQHSKIKARASSATQSAYFRRFCKRQFAEAVLSSDSGALWESTTTSWHTLKSSLVEIDSSCALFVCRFVVDVCVNATEVIRWSNTNGFLVILCLGVFVWHYIICTRGTFRAVFAGAVGSGVARGVRGRVSAGSTWRHLLESANGRKLYFFKFTWNF